MTGMVTYAGLDVHARSTHAAAIDVSTGELLRARFGPGIEEPVAWLAGLAGPVRDASMVSRGLWLVVCRGCVRGVA
jgi:hypothetical protein